MPQAIRRCSVLLGVALCAVLVGGVGVAQASDNTLRATLNVYGPKIKVDEAAIKSGVASYKRGKPKPLVRAISHELGDLGAMRRKLTHESASSRRGKKAKADIVRGVVLIIAAYSELKSAIQAAHGGPVNAAQVNDASAKADQGKPLIKKGLKLLS